VVQILGEGGLRDGAVSGLAWLRGFLPPASLTHDPRAGVMPMALALCCSSRCYTPTNHQPPQIHRPSALRLSTDRPTILLRHPSLRPSSPSRSLPEIPLSSPWPKRRPPSPGCRRRAADRPSHLVGRPTSVPPASATCIDGSILTCVLFVSCSPNSKFPRSRRA
jgi:hypothetical protein